MVSWLQSQYIVARDELTFVFVAGTLTRDMRKVERKKPGHVKARKMPTWVKR